MAKTDSRKFSVPGHPDYFLEADGSVMNYLRYVNNRKGQYYAPQFIGDGIIGEKGELYVVVGDPYDHRNHKVHRLVELIAVTMKQDPSQVRFRDGNPLNVRRGNLIFGPDPEEEAQAAQDASAPEQEPQPQAEDPNPVRRKVQCPHCDLECNVYNLRRHMIAKHPGAEMPAELVEIA